MQMWHHPVDLVSGRLISLELYAGLLHALDVAGCCV